MKKTFYVLCLSLILQLLICGTNVFAGADKKNNYDVAVRGLVLKYVLIDTAYEVYQVNDPTFAGKNVFSERGYRQRPDAYKHYKWLRDTYERFTPEMKNELATITRAKHPWGLMYNVTPLDDNASLAEIVERLEHLEGLSPEVKGAIRDFYPKFYATYLKAYLEKNTPIFDAYARKIKAEMAGKDIDVMGFMERVSGIKFDKKYRPVFYFTLRPIGALGFDYKDTKISTIQRYVKSSDGLLSTPFHEYSHSLFQTFTKSSAFKRVAEQMKNDPEFFKGWNGSKDSYDWRGWCEENLVNGFSLFLDYKYYNKKAEQGNYIYDLDFFNYLLSMNFDPAKTSLKDASIGFYKSKLKTEPSR